MTAVGRWRANLPLPLRLARRGLLGGSAQISEGGPFANGCSCDRSIVGAPATTPIRAGDETRYDALGAAGARPTTNAATLQQALRQLHCGAESFDE
jgi:hypothetical protein